MRSLFFEVEAREGAGFERHALHQLLVRWRQWWTHGWRFAGVWVLVVLSTSAVVARVVSSRVASVLCLFLLLARLTAAREGHGVTKRVQVDFFGDVLDLSVILNTGKTLHIIHERTSTNVVNYRTLFIRFTIVLLLRFRLRSILTHSVCRSRLLSRRQLVQVREHVVLVFVPR